MVSHTENLSVSVGVTLNKYIAFLIGLIVSLLSFTSAAYDGRYGDGRYGNSRYGDGRYGNSRYDDRYGRSHVKWVCNPYNKICRKVYRQDSRYSQYGRYGWQKNARKKYAVKNTEPKFVFVKPPEKIEGTNIINVNLAHGTWGAYDAEGNLVNSGHVSGGKSFCPDINKKCKTVTGTYTIYTKKGSECKSKIFPVGKGGAPMPYCMFFHEGFALHGANAVPNYNASHGCVRMSPADAKWLNQNFVSVGTTRVNVTYDKIEAPAELAQDEKIEDKKVQDKKVLSENKSE